MGATQIILIVMVVFLIIAYPILVSTRNKKANQKLTEQVNSLKRGDKVLTTAGVYGTVVDLQLEGDKKIVTIETGTDKKKGYISVDAYAIYTVLKDEAAAQNETSSAQEEKKAQTKVENKTEVKEEVKAEEILSETSTSASDLEAEVSGKKTRSKKKVD